MKGKQHPTNEVTINPSANESILDVISRAHVSRRHFVRTGISATTLAALGGVTMGGIIQTVDAAPVLDSSAKGFGGLGFDSIPPSLAPVADAVAVPPSYSVEVLASWGDPIMPGAPEWSEDATQDAAAQSVQYGMHNDGMHFFPLTWKGRHSSRRGLLCVNHEYTHEEILHGADGQTGGAGMTIEKARKSQAALGVSVLDIVKHRGQWKVNRRSPFARRITGNTRMRVSGPAAGHPLMRSEKFDITPLGSVPAGTNDGFSVDGTLNNCANGHTPWGTYLACEENWNGYFAAPTGGAAIGDTLADQKAAIIKGFNRYGVLTTPIGTLWPQVDPRFNADTNPLEPNLFGWVVEIDPFDPDGTPVKRTALGRMKHEGAQVAVSQEHRGAAHRVAFYMGDDERNEYVYKFVCDRPFKPGHRRANRDLLDDGTLYVAKFTSDPGKTHGTFRGAWIPLVPRTRTVFDDPNVPGRKLRLREVADFSAATDAEVQALILIKTRQAADAVGATMMDRPEWVALRTYDQRKTNGHVWNRLRDRWVDDDDSHDDWDHRDWGRDDHYDAYPVYNNTYPLELYCTLTNNNRRGGGGSTPVTSSNNPDGSTAAASARPAVDGANPRPDNDFGHIMRWREDGHVVTAVGFEWDLFVLCGDSITTKTLGSTGGAYVPTDLSDGTVGYIGNIVDIPDGSADFGAPDGVWFDQFGRLWIQTDQAGDGAGDWINIGANIMACADPNTKEIKRFLTSPRNCEVTGMTSTPDGRTLFVGIQHPGEGSPPSNPTQFSNWPQGQFAANSAGELFPNTPGSRRPRASVIVITRVDGGVVGD